ncbi:MAG: hypothetical protein J6W30_05300 [Bacteroidales bacterium]|nr:hypothetical protein [Bacteroidales bacterium]
MKKAIVTFFALVLFCTLSAQHLKFEGIPIDGSITNFQNQLSTKGISINSTKSKDAPLGQRVFNGKFQGYNSEITVFYGRKSKVVYKVKVVIESKKKEKIQNILDKSLKKIEDKYFYITNHDLHDDTSPIFRFNIFPTKTSEQSIGLIQVNPSHAYYITDDQNKPLEFACFTIEFIYEDRKNTDSTLPSDLEPHALPGFTCGDPESFGKFSQWMLYYIQNGCYERAQYYLYWLLDFYKYDCIPSYVHNYENGESQMDELIASLKEFCIGSIQAGVGMENVNVYRIVDNETGRFKFIEFDAKYFQGMLTNHIKFEKEDIPVLIRSLENLKRDFAIKESIISNQQSDKNWEENTNAYLPASLGKENTSTGEYGLIEWESTQLLSYYSYWDNVFSLNISAEDQFQFVFRFNNIEQIEDLIQFLKSIEF